MSITRTATFNVHTEALFVFTPVDYTNTSPETAVNLNAIGCPGNAVRFDTALFPSNVGTDAVVDVRRIFGQDPYFQVNLNQPFQDSGGISYPGNPPFDEVSVTVEVRIPSDVLVGNQLYGREFYPFLVELSNYPDPSFSDASSNGIMFHLTHGSSYASEGSPQHPPPLWAYGSSFYSIGSRNYITNDPAKTALDTWHTISIHYVKNAAGGPSIQIDGTDYGNISGHTFTTGISYVRVGDAGDSNFGRTSICQVRSIKIGTGGYGTSDLYSRDFSAGETFAVSPSDPPGPYGSPGVRGFDVDSAQITSYPLDQVAVDYGIPIEHQGWFKFKNTSNDFAYGRFKIDVLSTPFFTASLRAGLFLKSPTGQLHRAYTWMTDPSESTLSVNNNGISLVGDQFGQPPPPTTGYPSTVTLGCYVGPQETIYLVVGRSYLSNFSYYNSDATLKITAGFSTVTFYDTLDNVDGIPHPELAKPTEAPDVLAFPGIQETSDNVKIGDVLTYCHHDDSHFVVYQPAAPSNALGYGASGTPNKLYGDTSSTYGSDPNKANWPGYLEDATTLVILRWESDGSHTEIRMPPIIKYIWHPYDWTFHLGDSPGFCLSLFGPVMAHSNAVMDGWYSYGAIDHDNTVRDQQLVSDGENLWLIVLAAEEVEYPWLTDYNHHRCDVGHTVEHGPKWYWDNEPWSDPFYSDGRLFWYSASGQFFNSDGNGNGPPFDDAGFDFTLRWWPWKVIVYHLEGTEFVRIGDIEAKFDNRGTPYDVRPNVAIPTACASSADPGTCYVLWSERGGFGDQSGVNATGEHQGGSPTQGSRLVYATFSSSAKTAENELEYTDDITASYGGYNLQSEARSKLYPYSRLVNEHGFPPTWISVKNKITDWGPGGRQGNGPGYRYIDDENYYPVLRLRSMANPLVDAQTIDTDLIPTAGDTFQGYVNTAIVANNDPPFVRSNMYLDEGGLGENVYGITVSWATTTSATVYAIYRAPADLASRPSYLDGIRLQNYSIFANSLITPRDWYREQRNLWSPNTSGGESLAGMSQLDYLCLHGWTGTPAVWRFFGDPFIHRDTRVVPYFDATTESFWFGGEGGVEVLDGTPGGSHFEQFFGVTRSHVLRDFLICTVGDFIVCIQGTGLYGWVRF